MTYLIVFIGAGIGGALRHFVNIAALRFFGPQFPYGTLIVNVLGSFIMGLLTALWLAKTQLPPHLRLFLTTGILGGFTTFSTFALDSAALWERGAPALTVVYIGFSIGLSLAAVFAGLMLVRIFAAA